MVVVIVLLVEKVQVDEGVVDLTVHIVIEQGTSEILVMGYMDSHLELSIEQLLGGSSFHRGTTFNFYSPRCSFG